MTKKKGAACSFYLFSFSYLLIFSILSINQCYFINDLINLLIFISIIIFIFCIGKIEKDTRSAIFSLIVSYCTINIIYAWGFSGVYVYKSSSSARKKACFSNIRIIRGAIEMYNMDVPESDYMRKLDLNLLIEKKYLKSITPPEDFCKYVSMDDLSDNGVVYCVSHGIPEMKEGATSSQEAYVDSIMLERIKKEISKERDNPISNQNISNSKVIKNFFESKDILFPIRILFFPETFNRFR